VETEILLHNKCFRTTKVTVGNESTSLTLVAMQNMKVQFKYEVSVALQQIYSYDTESGQEPHPDIHCNVQL
jgi:hypothetical protein